MSHGNATLSPLGRLKLARFHVHSGASIRASAERFQVSTTTVLRWSRRYRQVLAQGVVKLLGVDAKMHPAHPQPVGAHRGRHGLERAGGVVIRLLRIGFQPVDQRIERQQLVRMIGGQPVGGL